MAHGAYRKSLIFFGIIAIACFFLFFHLPQADTLTDEVEVAFRSVGYVDFLATPFQTTPYEWFEQAPWWAKLSFHDHPPLVFIIEHFVFRLFGDGLWALRLPFALFGLGSLLLLYSIARMLWGQRAGVLVLLLSVVNSYLIWVSRIGLQEGAGIFFGLLGIFFLLKSKSERRYFLGWGAAAGLAFLSKYTGLIVLPVSAAYLLLLDRPALKEKFFYAGGAVILVFFSPVIIYNGAMFAAKGHFDLQFSTLFGQRVAVWQNLPGKNIAASGNVSSPSILRCIRTRRRYFSLCLSWRLFGW